MVSDWWVPCAKLVGISFGINEMTGSREEEGRKLKLICCPSSGSKGRVEDTKKGNFRGSSLDNNVGTCSTGCGSGLGFSRFSSLRGGFCGFSEGVNLNKKEGSLGMNGKIEHDTSRKNQKRAALEEDADWFPEQESFIQLPGTENRGDSVGKRSKMKCDQNGKHQCGENDGVDVSIPGGQPTLAPNNLKHLLLPAGWTVVSQQGLSDLLYVSPSGSAYGSLPKAMNAFSLDASEFRKKEQGSYQSEQSGSICCYTNIHEHSLGSKHVVKNTPKVKETVDQIAQMDAPAKPVNLEDILFWDRDKIKEYSTNPVEMVSSGVHNVVACCKDGEEAQSCIKNGSFSSGTKNLNYSTVVMPKANHHDDIEIQQCDSSIGVLQSVLINGKVVPVGDKVEMKIKEDENLIKSSKCEEFMTGSLLLQKPQNHKETQEEALPVSHDTGGKQTSDVAAVDKRVNQEKKNPSGCSGAVIKDKQSNVNINEDAKLHGVRRSKRINGRRVPVDTELNLEFWDDDDYLDSCRSVNMFTTDTRLGTREPDNTIDKEVSPMPKEVRYKKVNEVFSGFADASTLLEKQKPGVSGSSTEMHKGLVFHLEDESTFMDLLSQDMLPAEPEADSESDSEMIPKVRERRYREVYDIMTSCMADKKGKSKAESCTDCSSDGAQKLDSTGALVVDNGIDRNGDMHQHGEMVELRRSTRINGKHVPVDGELDIDMWDFDDFIDLSIFVDDKVEKKDKEKLANSNSKMIDIVFCLPASGYVDDRFGKKFKERSACSSSEVEDIVVALPAPGFLKLAAATKSDCQKPRDQGPVEQIATTNSGNHKPRNQGQLDGTLCLHRKVPRKCAREKTPVAEEGYFLLLNNGTKALKQTAPWESDNQKPRNQEQVEQTITRKSNNQKPRNQEQMDSDSLPCVHGKKKCAGVKTLVTEKGAPSLLRNRTKVPLTEKRSPLSPSKRKPVKCKHSNGKKKKKRSGGCGLVVRRTVKGDYGKHIRSETKYSILSWLIDNGVLDENEKVFYKAKNGKGNITKGCIIRGGIQCNCCRKDWSLSEFEDHAGSNIHQPWINTCLISGKSLMHCQSEAWEREKKERKVGFHTVRAGDADPSDDTCGICADGGHLICCDGCLSTFHQECVMLKMVPEGSWYCPFCRCVICLLADGGQNKPDCNFSIFSCNQCGCKYHRDCVLEKDKDEILSFCGENCKKVATVLSDILGVSNPLDGGFSWTLLRRLDEDEGDCINSDQRLSFIMECNVKLALALSVLEECFVPLVDPRTGLDMIVQAVYSCGSNYNRLNCERFYTMILEKDDEIISVATLRLHGTRLAEMPFIGTRPIYRRKGMCRRLFNSLVKMLSLLHVEKLIIPAIPDLLETWMTSFSFKPLESSHREEIRNLNMMIFADTTLLQKSLRNMETNEASDKKQVGIVSDLEKVIEQNSFATACCWQPEC